MKTNKGIATLIVLAIILGVLVVGGGAYWMGKSDLKVKFLNFNKNQTQEQGKEIPTKGNETEQNEQMTLTYNNKEYSFINSECKIGGIIDRGLKTWNMTLKLMEKDNNSITFNLYSNENNIDSYLKDKINIATRGVKISNNLTSNGYSDEVSSDISVVWNKITSIKNTFSGNGYIEINKDRKPNEGICNGLKTVNQKYITSNDPEYKYLCPSPIIPVQKVYFKCLNGVINRTPNFTNYTPI